MKPTIAVLAGCTLAAGFGAAATAQNAGTSTYSNAQGAAGAAQNAGTPTNAQGAAGQAQTGATSTNANAQGAAGAAQDAGTPTYTNAQVVSINTLDRTFVIRQADGTQQSVELDDSVAGFGDVRAGDEVILSMRGEPGRSRASSIRKSTGAAPSATQPPGPAAPPGGPAPEVAAEAFARQVSGLASEADRVDRLWNAFRTTCDARVGSRYEGGREWFAFWANDVRADLSNGTCRDLYNQIVGLGETVKRGMAGAEDAARRSLSPGDIRDVRLRYSMDWDGWALPAPERQRL